jgi:hypothetical protein
MAHLGPGNITTPIALACHSWDDGKSYHEEPNLHPVTGSGRMRQDKKNVTFH